MFLFLILYLSLFLTVGVARLALKGSQILYCTVCTSVFTFTASAFLRDCIYKNVFLVVLAVNSDYACIPKRHYPIGRCEVVATRMSLVEAVDRQRVLPFPASCGTGKFMAAFARALLYSVFRTRRMQAMSCRRI